MQFRKGDVVSVQGTVEYDFDSGPVEQYKVLFIKVDGKYDSIGLTPDKFDGASLKLIRAKFEIGDWVLWDGGISCGECGEVVGISGDHAWIDNGQRQLLHAAFRRHRTRSRAPDGGARCSRLTNLLFRRGL